VCLQVFVAITACVAHWQRRPEAPREGSRDLLLLLTAADACSWLSESQQARIGSWLSQLGAALVRARFDGPAAAAAALQG
jgi:hypothetical protein